MNSTQQNCEAKNQYKLKQIAKSSNSFIYKQVDQNEKPTGKAFKVIPHQKDQCSSHQKECEHLANEYVILNQICHENIIKVHSILQDGQSKDFKYCMLEQELADMDFFDLIQKHYPKQLPLNELKRILKQILIAIKHIHLDKNIAHNDIKLENIFMFGSNAKLADFGFATVQNTLDSKKQKTNWQKRCRAHLSPELLQLIDSKYHFNFVIDEKKADIFALGITIFSLFYLQSPFASEQASFQDRRYRHFYSKKYNLFWQDEEIKGITSILKNIHPQFEEEKFQDLISKMLEVDPNKRIDIQQVIDHPWFAENNDKN